MATPTCALFGADTVVDVETGEIVTAADGVTPSVVAQSVIVKVAAPTAVGVQTKVAVPFTSEPTTGE